jgi:hypothetical protein
MIDFGASTERPSASLETALEYAVFRIPQLLPARIDFVH